ncbi:hypothetical protein SAY86_014758 [Trapa natans]|uniref:non-specific serine/threonine protein kinase n=1 Tax=Trapa natans TaxID=22666 RepID=A0AAN7KII5_TRANT|nr:hypothetical protein SAY86_014758 [Trapa natans]
MGACWSNKIKADTTPLQTGVTSRSAGDEDPGISRVSDPATPRSETEILQSSNLKSFSFGELRSATRNFRPDSVLGGGGFGSVFKGWIDEQTFGPAKPGTGMIVAVKKLNQEGPQGHREWLAEINYLGHLHHPNLVRLIGFCLEDEQRLLVYEFMPRGSMENHLFRRGTYFQPLSWSHRVRVALGAARGLAFLHNSEPKVIYRDFKTSNILLDPNYNAKLSDFGLARDGPTDQKSHVSTRVMGTYGYAAPEYLATGRRVIDKNKPQEQHNLVDWAKPYLTNKRRILHVMDARLQGQYSLDQAQMVAKLALGCLDAEPRLRPNMDDVVKELEQLSSRKHQHNRQHHQTSNCRESLLSGPQNNTAAGSLAYPRPSASPFFFQAMK